MADLPLRVCRLCRVAKPETDYFGPSKKGKRQADCRDCTHERLAALKVRKQAEREQARLDAAALARAETVLVRRAPPKKGRAQRSPQQILEEVLDDRAFEALLRLGVKLALGKSPGTERPPDKDMLRALLERKLGRVPERASAHTGPLDAFAERIMRLAAVPEGPGAGLDVPDAALGGGGLYAEPGAGGLPPGDGGLAAGGDDGAGEAGDGRGAGGEELFGGDGVVQPPD
jgi:hypothetical protein